MSWPGSIPDAALGDTAPLSPINFTYLIKAFDEIRQILHALDSHSFRSGISSIFGRPHTLSAKAQTLENILYVSNTQLRKCYVGCQAHLEDVSANDLKKRVLEQPRFASVLRKARLTLQRSEENMADIRTAFEAHLVFTKQPSASEYIKYSKTIFDMVATLCDMTKVLNKIYLETLNSVTGFEYIEMPNFELRKVEQPSEDDEYLLQVAWEVNRWMDRVLMVPQDPIVMAD